MQKTVVENMSAADRIAAARPHMAAIKAKYGSALKPYRVMGEDI